MNRKERTVSQLSHGCLLSLNDEPSIEKVNFRSRGCHFFGRKGDGTRGWQTKQFQNLMRRKCPDPWSCKGTLQIECFFIQHLRLSKQQCKRNESVFAFLEEGSIFAWAEFGLSLSPIDSIRFLIWNPTDIRRQILTDAKIWGVAGIKKRIRSILKELLLELCSNDTVPLFSSVLKVCSQLFQWHLMRFDHHFPSSEKKKQGVSRAEAWAEDANGFEMRLLEL